MADGALRSDVLKVLAEEGVEYETLPSDRYRLVKGDVVLTVRMQQTVSRTTLSNFERRFGITKARFFPPIAKVLPMNRPRAAGENE